MTTSPAVPRIALFTDSFHEVNGVALTYRQLDAFCAERHIDLVPNQQSLGHFHRWLVHDEYRGLAEGPEGVQHPFATAREPFSLAPVRAESLGFVSELHSELLESFDVKDFAVRAERPHDTRFSSDIPPELET